MITTTVTSANFKKFSKSLSKNTKTQEKPISLLTAQEVLAKTFGYSNHHEFIQTSKKDNYKPIILGENNFKQFVERFKLVLNALDFNYPDDISFKIFQTTFGLEEDRKLSPTDIIVELNNMKKNGTARFDKLFFARSSKNECLFFLTYEVFNYKLIEELNKSINKDDYNALFADIHKNYKNFERITLKHDKENLYHSIKYISTDKKQQLKFIELIDQLYEFSDSEILEALHKNYMHFMMVNSSIFAVSCPLRENNYLINQSITYKKYLVVNKDILNMFKNKEKTNGWIKMFLTNSGIPVKDYYKNEDSAIQKIKEIDNHIVLIVYENRLSSDEGKFIFFNEYLEKNGDNIQSYPI